jgi:hypothetical protein
MVLAIESVVEGSKPALFAALVCLATACGSEESGASSLPSPAMGGMAAGGTAAAGGVPTVPLETGEPTACPLTPSLDPAQTARLSLRVPVEFAGAPVALGSSVSAPSGSVYKLTFFAYYLGNFQLIDSAGAEHPALLVDANDEPLPYGLQLVNMDDEATEQLRLAVAPGDYRSLRFGVGAQQACNASPLAERSWPLTIESEMDWGWTMLHLRLEGFLSSSARNVGLI